MSATALPPSPRSPVDDPRPAADVRHWHALSGEETYAALRTDGELGLTRAEARERLERLGRNELAEGPRRNWTNMLVDQFRDMVVWILLAAVALSLWMGEMTDAIVVISIVVLNAVLGVVQESKAERSLAALRQLAAPKARVVRDGTPVDLSAAELVPGDLVLLEAGNLLPADLRLVESAALRVEEAALTGESEAVEKDAGVVLDPETCLGDQVNRAFAGTSVVAGRGRGVVVATGSGTEIGGIARLLGEINADPTPLQQRLEGLGKALAVLVLGICVIVFLAGWMRGHPVAELFLTAVSLAVAAVPEGLPAIVTIVLALGTTNMVRRHVIVRRLSAVEALGSTTVICTDKTGTLTQNRMTVRRYWTTAWRGTVDGSGDTPEGQFLTAEGTPQPTDQDPLPCLLELAALCNDATLRRDGDAWAAQGDPTETALLVAAAKGGIDRNALLERMPRRAEAPFDSARKRMSTVHPLPEGGFRIVTKGAPGEVLRYSAQLLEPDGSREMTEQDRRALLEEIQRWGDEALRVLAFAYRDVPEMPADLSPASLERDLFFVGLLGMIDPPRPEAKAAIATCREAGIHTVIITGDYGGTARAIARELDVPTGDGALLTGTELEHLSGEELRARIRQVTVYARVSPADKLRIVTALQAQGESVAMTGDGVNDAPALKKADIGVAMGQVGTDVARGAADIVLTDDNFASIVAAVEEGRQIFVNIRRFVFYLLSCNISEVATIFLAILAGLPQPLLAVQILWVNLVTDGLPALALGVEPKEPGLMRQPPRPPQEGVLNRQTSRDIAFYGIFITLATLAAYLHGLYWLCLIPAGHTGLDALQTAMRASFWANPALEDGLREARTLAFGTLAFSQLAHAFNCRSERESLLTLKPWTNPHLVAAVTLSAAAQLAVIYLPFANRIFYTTPITGTTLLVGIALSLSPLLFGELRKWVVRRTPVAV